MEAGGETAVLGFSRPGAHGGRVANLETLSETAQSDNQVLNS
jgi:hypothetical protein